MGPLPAARRSLAPLGRTRVALWRSCVALGLDLGWLSAFIFKFFMKTAPPRLLSLVPSENAIYAIPWPPLGTLWALLDSLGAPWWGSLGRPLTAIGCSWDAPGPPKGSQKAGPSSYSRGPAGQVEPRETIQVAISAFQRTMFARDQRQMLGRGAFSLETADKSEECASRGEVGPPWWS